MSNINQDIIAQLGGLQGSIWEHAATAATEAFGREVQITDPLTVASPTQDAISDLSGPMVVLKFALASSPDNHQVILIPTDLAKTLAGIIRAEDVADLGEDVLSELKPFCQALATGLCKGIAANTKPPNDSPEDGLITFAIARQILELPDNMQQSEELVRVQAGLNGPELSGSITWLLDDETAKSILGITDGADETFEQAGAQAEPTQAAGQTGELEMLLDIPLQVSVELGRVKMLVQDVIDLSTGSVVEIDKAAGDPVDVLVNGKLVARGEVVVVDDNFGVRVTEILSLQERVHRLGEAA